MLPTKRDLMAESDSLNAHFYFVNFLKQSYKCYRLQFQVFFEKKAEYIYNKKRYWFY